VRYGVARGLVSNEAGCGTAPIAHASAEVLYPAEQGIWGIVEVFVDTILLCTMSALVILTSGVPVKSGGGMAYALAAYEAVLGKFAAPLLAVSVLIFAFATVLCWAHYGRESVYALCGKDGGKLLPLFEALACFVGTIAAPALVWELTDLVLALMTLLNLTALLLLRREVREESRR
jgi:AGCS family alanine or glycine:cation symporter